MFDIIVIYRHYFVKEKIKMLLFKEPVPGIKILETPFGGLWSGVVLIKGRENILIDSGASTEIVDTCLIPALKNEDLEPGDIHWLLNTHCHGDHVGGHRRFRELSNAKIATLRGSLDKMRYPLKYNKLIRASFPDYSPPASAGLQGLEPDILLDDNDTIAGRLQLIHTPGHDTDSVCWLDTTTNTLISGDSLQANGTILQGIGFYLDLKGYRNSLCRLQTLKIDNIITGHPYEPCGSSAIGTEKSAAYLRKCLYLTDTYDILIREIKRTGISEPAQIAVQLIERLGGNLPEYLFLALYTVCEHLKEDYA